MTAALELRPRSGRAWLISDDGAKTMNARLPLLFSLAAIVMTGCAATNRDAAISLLPLGDTYRWHPYHLTRDTPESPDGVFRLVGVSKEGSAELLFHGETRIIVKKDPSTDELAASRMPMRVTKFDFATQAVHFEWLTTN